MMQTEGYPIHRREEENKMRKKKAKKMSFCSAIFNTQDTRVERRKFDGKLFRVKGTPKGRGPF
jgi:hypothetical protein